MASPSRDGGSADSSITASISSVVGSQTIRLVMSSVKNAVSASLEPVALEAGLTARDAVSAEGHDALFAPVELGVDRVLRDSRLLAVRNQELASHRADESVPRELTRLAYGDALEIRRFAERDVARGVAVRVEDHRMQRGRRGPVSSSESVSSSVSPSVQAAELLKKM
jgi:hypothetical protein